MPRKPQPEVIRLFAEAFLANGGKPSEAARAVGVKGTPGSLAVKANRLQRSLAA